MSRRISGGRVLAVAAVAALAACGDNPAGPSHPNDPVGAEVFLRGTEERIAYVHGTHWHGSIELTVGEEVEVDVRFLDADGAVIPLGGHYEVRAEIAPGHPEGIVQVESHGDHVGVEAEAAGETRILFHFWRDGHAEWTTPALRVAVS